VWRAEHLDVPVDVAVWRLLAAAGYEDTEDRGSPGSWHPESEGAYHSDNLDTYFAGLSDDMAQIERARLLPDY